MKKSPALTNAIGATNILLGRPMTLADNPKEAGLTKLFVIDLPFKLISKSNHKGAARYLPAKYRVFEESVAHMAFFATKKKCMMKEGWVVIRPHFKNKIHIDLANIGKSLIDGLVKGSVFSDDKYLAVTVVPAVYGDELSECEIWA